MKSEAKTNSNLSVQDWTGTDEQDSQSDICKLIFEGMMTIFIILVFLFIAQNWVLTNTEDTLFSPTCSLTEGRVGIGGSISNEANNTIDSYKLILQ
ncbi:MAG: hypothetical protein H8D23_29905 [Candidatus Brocadiales bacterium]|nr:hypothetical protein [Candidatus Brocadiales bacterium]